MRAVKRYQFSALAVASGSWLLTGRSVAAPTIPLPEPGTELGLLPGLGMLGLFVAVLAVELVRPRRSRSAATPRRWLGNLSLCILSNGIFVLPAVTAFSAALLREFDQGGLLAALGLPSGLRIVIAIVGLDALAYALHRLLHRVDLFWRLHAVHHSDPEIDVTTTFRHHPIEALLNSALIGGVVFSVGFSPGEIAAFTWVSFVVQLVAHANIGLPSRFSVILGRLIVTPEFHRLHHSRSGHEVNSNFGQIFTVWDRLLGTACARSEQDRRPLDFGLDQFRERKSHLPHFLLAQPLLLRANGSAQTAGPRP